MTRKRSRSSNIVITNVRNNYNKNNKDNNNNDDNDDDAPQLLKKDQDYISSQTQPKKKKRTIQHCSSSSAASSSMSLSQLSINKKFAAQYTAQKRRQLLSRIPTSIFDDDNKKNDDDEGRGDDQSHDGSIYNSSRTSSSSEDEWAELLTKKVDRKIVKTIDLVRRRDPSIYDPKIRFFGEGDDEGDGNERGGEGSGDEEEEKEGEGERKKINHEDENKNNNDDGDEDDEPLVGWEFLEKMEKKGTVVPKMRIRDYVRENLLKDGRLSDSESDHHTQTEREKNNTCDFQDQRPMDKDVGEVVPFKDNHSENDTDGDDDDEFFKKKESSKYDLSLSSKKDGLPEVAKGKSRFANSKVDLHAHLMAPEDEKERFLQEFVLNNGWLEGNAESAPCTAITDNIDLSEDENQIDKADAFETKYNFRFEDAAAQAIMTHPRKVQGSLRRIDDRRKRARKAREERKRIENMEKVEEIKRLKNEKRKEIFARLQAIQEAAGEDLGFEEMDLEDDFDPRKFSKVMESKFDDKYYKKTDVLLEKEKESGQRMSLANDTEDHDGMTDEVKAMMDEYYELDYEDIIGGEPVRFRYKHVDAEDFKMTSDEILATEDGELNRQVSLKYLAPYRTRAEIPKKIFNKSRRNWLARQQNDGQVNTSIRQSTEKHLGEKGKKKKRGTKIPVGKDGPDTPHKLKDGLNKRLDMVRAQELRKSKRKGDGKRKKHKNSGIQVPELSEGRRQAYGLL